MRLLLVEDDAMIGTGIQVGLRHEGYVVDWVHDAEAAEAALGPEDAGFALVLLDLGLPDGDGLTLLSQIRRTRQGMPVLILSARDALSDRLRRKLYQEVIRTVRGVGYVIDPAQQARGA